MYYCDVPRVCFNKTIIVKYFWRTQMKLIYFKEYILILALTLANMQRIMTDFSGRCWRLLDQRNLEIVDVSFTGPTGL